MTVQWFTSIKLDNCKFLSVPAPYPKRINYSEINTKIYYCSSIVFRFQMPSMPNKEFFQSFFLFQSTLPWLCTPFLNAVAENDERKKQFNKVFSKCRVVVENVIGILKTRFPILKNGIKFECMKKTAKFIQGETDR